MYAETTGEERVSPSLLDSFHHLLYWPLSGRHIRYNKWENNTRQINMLPSQVLVNKASPSLAPAVKVEVESSVESEEKVRNDFQSSLRRTDNEKLPEITIIQVVKQTEEKPSQTLPPTVPLPTVNLTKLTVPYKLQSDDRRLRSLHFKRFDGSEEVPKWSIYQERSFDALTPNVTLVTVISEDLFSPDLFVDSWSGLGNDRLLMSRPIMRIVAAKLNSSSIKDMITASSLPSRVCTLLCSMSEKSIYSPTAMPINLLRNVALLHVMSSHVLFVDGDMRIPCGCSSCV